MTSLKAVWAEFDPDTHHQAAMALRVNVQEHDSEAPMHQHRKGQLVVALRGAVTCEVQGGLWMVPPQCGVWIPGGTPHSNRVTANGHICFLFVEPSAAALPSGCCTLSLSPLVVELIQHLADLGPLYDAQSHTARLVTVLLEELAVMKTEQLHLPMPGHAALRKIAAALTRDPSDRRKVADWAQRVAMSERTLARLVVQETGMTFGRWRQQLHIIMALQKLSAGRSVQAVSDDLGYESPSAFITMFKKVLGKPPARYIADKSGR